MGDERGTQTEESTDGPPRSGPFDMEFAPTLDARTGMPPIQVDVVVYGAGITGLTVAHELAQRNFTVVVVEPDFDAWTPLEPSGHNENPGIGGVARSQWGFMANDPGAVDPMQSAAPATKMLKTERVPSRFSPVPFDITVVNGHVLLREQPREKELDEAIYRALAAMAEIDDTPLSARIQTRALVELDACQAAKEEVLARFRRVLVERGLPERLLQRLHAKEVVVRPSQVVDGPERFTFQPNVFALPGEHGFRFFPSFYRHVFDTLRKIPATLQRSDTAEGETSDLIRRGRDSVFDNLVSVRNVGYVGGDAGRSAIIPRPRLRSAEEARRVMADMLRETGYSTTDLARLGLKVWKYATSCRARREAEYEHLSWYEFVEGDRFSERGRFLLNSTPGTLGGLFGADADARTQGTVLLQCTRDHSDEGVGTDMLLNGPTDEAWFGHWHRHLLRQGVNFIPGRLTGFTFEDGAMRPVVEARLPSGQGTFEVRFAPVEREGDEPHVGKQVHHVVAGALMEAQALAEQYLAEARANGVDDPSMRDLRALVAFPQFDNEGLRAEVRKPYPAGPLRHLSGVQYFFAQPMRFFAAHTQFLDAPSGLTAVAQPQFWLNPQAFATGFRGVLSVDIGIWGKVPGAADDGWFAWGKTRRELAQRVWAQIAEGHAGDYPGPWPRLPLPTAYRVDENLVFSAAPPHRLEDDRAPFLVNETGRFRARPGGMADADDPTGVRIAYDVAPGGVVLAGTYMQTRTRINSMEAANESGRHAVNAILRALDLPGDPCQIWDPEDHEDDALLADREIDAALFAKGMPHMSEILGVDRLDAWLPPDTERTR